MSDEKISDKKREMPGTDALMAILPVLFGIIVFLDVNIIGLSDIVTEIIIFPIRIVAFLFFFIWGLIFIILSHKAIFGDEHHASNKLLTSGILARTRNPMYFGINLIFISVISLTGSILGLVFWILVFIFLFNQMARYEENILEKIFGDEYLTYKKNVPRWIPKMF
ncbi:MAG: hypothetical protein GF364_00055 [Candidatus Lokiarchaeota archaeon]|nr:hypothetical protein [Candidatus Lokiarchaeota archaeon]